MLFLFTVAFIVTLIGAAYMQFGSQAERYVLQYKLNADGIFAVGGASMFMFSLAALSNSGLGMGLALTIIVFSWIPCALIGFNIERIQKSFDDLYELGKKLNSKRTKIGMLEQNAVTFFIEMERIHQGQKNRVHRALLAHKRHCDCK